MLCFGAVYISLLMLLLILQHRFSLREMQKGLLYSRYQVSYCSKSEPNYQRAAAAVALLCGAVHNQQAHVPQPAAYDICAIADSDTASLCVRRLLQSRQLLCCSAAAAAAAAGAAARRDEFRIRAANRAIRALELLPTPLQSLQVHTLS
jgi:hypothetical protein